MRRCVWSRNLNNGEAMACVGPQRHGLGGTSNLQFSSSSKYIRVFYVILDSDGSQFQLVPPFGFLRCGITWLRKQLSDYIARAKRTRLVWIKSTSIFIVRNWHSHHICHRWQVCIEGRSPCTSKCHDINIVAYINVSQSLWDRGPVNSFFVRRGSGPNIFTRKYLSIFLSSYIKLT